MTDSPVVASCRSIIDAYNRGLLGTYAPAESIAPKFHDQEGWLRYYTLPMAINYRRPSEQLWNAAKASYLDEATSQLFDLPFVMNASLEEVRHLLSIHKLAMQPTTHTAIWKTISTTIHTEWGGVTGLLEAVDYDFLRLKETVQRTHKKGFPYLSGPKIFNFWSYILTTRCDVDFKHKEYIDIAIDGHIKRSSIELGVITPEEAQSLPSEQIAARWRRLLQTSDFTPVDLNIPLWYWSRDKFQFKEGVYSAVTKQDATL